MQNGQDYNERLSKAQGQVLVKLARNTITEKMGGTPDGWESDTLATALQDEAFKSQCGTFVTLKIKGQLRGCIGNLTSTESILDGVRRNAVSAAFHDPRFSPLSNDELNQMEIEVSILSEPRPIDYQNGKDLLEKLRVNLDGVIIRKGHASGTFLPQVWEQLPKPEDFLSHLCIKAGLSANAWKRSKLNVSTYQVQYFEESE